MYIQCLYPPFLRCLIEALSWHLISYVIPSYGWIPHVVTGDHAWMSSRCLLGASASGMHHADCEAWKWLSEANLYTKAP